MDENIINEDEIEELEFSEVVDKYIDQHGLYRTEGDTGTKNLCKLVNAMGYEDNRHFGQFAHNGSYGDLLEFFNDNSGAIEAVMEWIREQNVPEWKEELESKLAGSEEE